MSLTRWQTEVLRYYERYKTSTDWLMDERMKVRGINEHTVSTMRSRRNDLVKLGYIEDTGRTMQHGHNKRNRKVWRLAGWKEET